MHDDQRIDPHAPRFGAEGDLTDRVVIQASGGVWFGPGLDSVVGSRGGLGCRF